MRPGERVRLVHELRQLRGAEELLQRRHDGPDVDDRLRRDRVDVLRRHPLADDALHAVEPDAERLLDQLADGAQAPVAEVLVLVELGRGSDRAGARSRRRRSPSSPRATPSMSGSSTSFWTSARMSSVVRTRVSSGTFDAEPLVELVAADLRQVVALGVEEERLEQVPRVVERRRLTRALLLEDLDQRLFLARGRVLLERVDDEDRVVEQLQDRLVRAGVELEARSSGPPRGARAAAS